MDVNFIEEINQKLGPKVITSEGNTQAIAKIVKEKTGKVVSG